jgi:hypothetical protein
MEGRRTIAIGGALALLMIVSGALAGFASASVTVRVRQPCCDDSRFPFGGDVDVTGSDHSERISVSSNAKRVLKVHADTRVAERKERYCVSLRARLLRCRTQEVADGFVEGMGGRDVILTSIGAGPDLIVDGGRSSDELWDRGGDRYLLGGPDADVIHGGAGPDWLQGDDVLGDKGASAGADRLFGGPGDDELGDFFDRGADVMRGGQGDDDLWAVNKSTQAVIDGGRGEDRCTIEKRDPRPVNCEEIKVKASNRVARVEAATRKSWRFPVTASSADPLPASR